MDQPLNSLKKKRVAALTDAKNVLNQIGKIYKELRRGEISATDAVKSTRVLKEAMAAVEVADLARRLEALELEVGSRR